LLAADVSELPLPELLDPDPKGSPLPPADVVAAAAEPDCVDDSDVEPAAEVELVTVAIVVAAAETLEDLVGLGAVDDEAGPDEAELAGVDDEDEEDDAMLSMVPKPATISESFCYWHE
jgi:hypothetical protein